MKYDENNAFFETIIPSSTSFSLETTPDILESIKKKQHITESELNILTWKARRNNTVLQMLHVAIAQGFFNGNE